jgi:hypothetical protein
MTIWRLVSGSKCFIREGLARVLGGERADDVVLADLAGIGLGLDAGLGRWAHGTPPGRRLTWGQPRVDVHCSLVDDQGSQSSGTRHEWRQPRVDVHCSESSGTRQALAGVSYSSPSEGMTAPRGVGIRFGRTTGIIAGRSSKRKSPAWEFRFCSREG